MNIENKIFLFENQTTLKAIAETTIIINDIYIRIKGIKIVTGKNNKNFVSFPQREFEKDNKKEYRPIIEFSTFLKKQLSQSIINSFNISKALAKEKELANKEVPNEEKDIWKDKVKPTILTNKNKSVEIEDFFDIPKEMLKQEAKIEPKKEEKKVTAKDLGLPWDLDF